MPRVRAQTRGKGFLGVGFGLELRVYYLGGRAVVEEGGEVWNVFLYFVPVVSSFVYSVISNTKLNTLYLWFYSHGLY